MTKEERREYEKRYRQEHKEQIREYQRKYRQLHKKEKHIYNHNYRESHKEELAKYFKIYYQKHRDYILLKSKCQRNNWDLTLFELRNPNLFNNTYNGCSEYSDCLTCPKEHCIYD